MSKVSQYLIDKKYSLLYFLWLVASVSLLHADVKESSPRLTELHISGAIVNPGTYLVSNRGLVNAIFLAGGVSLGGCASRTHISGVRPNGEKLMGRVNVLEIIENDGNDFWVPINFSISVSQGFIGCNEEIFNENLESYILKKSRLEQQVFKKALAESLEIEAGMQKKP